MIQTLSSLSKIFLFIKRKQILEITKEETTIKENLLIFARKLLCFKIVIDQEFIADDSDTKFSEILKANLEDNISELDLILDFLTINKNLENESSSIFELKKILNKMKQAILKTKADQMNEESTDISLTLDTVKIKLHKVLDFWLVPIENQFGNFYQNYLYQKCEFCKKKPGKNSFMVCLLCGDIVCFKNCSQSAANQSNIGNLCTHSMFKHSGVCIFVNTINGTHWAVEAPRVFSFDGLYQNALGFTFHESEKNISESDLEYNEFLLDQDEIEKLRRDLLELRMADKIVQENVNKGKYYRPLQL